MHQFLISVSLCLFCQPLFNPAVGITQEAPDDKITPEQMGFSARTVKSKDGMVRYYVSTEGKPLDEKRKLPLVLYLDGSGPSPLFWGDENRMGSSLMFDAADFPGYHFAVISKPGVKFHENERRIESELFEKVMSLPWRVNAAHAVINQLATEEFIDRQQVLVIGHSEGADVAPRVALENPHVTHVAGLAPGGVSQMFDFVLFVRKRVAAGKLSKAEGDRQIREIKAAYRKIFADPTSTTKKWRGETYLRWSTFFRPGIEAWREIEKPVYLAICRDDENTPVECGEAIELEFIRLGKRNLTSKVWPCDHYFVEMPEDKNSEPTERLKDILQDIQAWAKTK